MLLCLAAATVLVVPALVYPANATEPSDGAAGQADISGLAADASPASLVDGELPARLAGLAPQEAVPGVAEEPALAVAAVSRDPRAFPGDAYASAIAAVSRAGVGAAEVRAFFARMSADDAMWAAALFPEAVGNLDGAPYPVRIAANRIRLTAETASSSRIPAPVWSAPWNLSALPYRHFFAGANARGHQLVYFDPNANNGQGSWAELIGDLSTADHVGLLVPGGSASVVSDNFIRYAMRARSFTDAPEAKGRLAMVVWAGGEFPSGWFQEGMAAYAESTAPRLAAFSQDLRTRMAPGARLIAVGHSYGGPVVGLAETHGLDADVVLHLASAGSGHGVQSVRDYDVPCRTRYSMTAPADLIGYVQGSGDAPGVGHGLDPDDMAGTILLDTGFHVDDPAATDDIGRPLGPLAGTEIRGIHAHSEIFNPGSGGWRNVLAVLTDGPVVLRAGPQPPPVPGCGP